VPGRAKGFGSQCHNSTLWDHALAPRVALKRRGSGLRVATPGMIAHRVRRPLFGANLVSDYPELERTRHSNTEKRAFHSGGIENGFIVVAVDLPATEAAAGRHTTGSIGQILRVSGSEAHEPGVSDCCGQIMIARAGDLKSAVVRGSMSELSRRHAVDFPAPCSLLAIWTG
jgi:hypothetical protein